MTSKTRAWEAVKQLLEGWESVEEGWQDKRWVERPCDEVAEVFAVALDAHATAERERCARAVCIGCARNVERKPPDAQYPKWSHEGYPWRCDADAIWST